MTCWTMVRWVGNAGHPSDRLRLEQWARRLDSWRREGLSQACFFLHQKDEAHCVAGIRQLAGQAALADWDPDARLWRDGRDDAPGGASQRGQQTLF